MRTFKAILSIFLAVLMAFTTVINCVAAESAQYIKEIRIGYGDDGKAALKEAGYTVWEELNANEGGRGGDVWLGYKTTTEKDEAITDLAVMNMNGGYSISAYSEKLTELKKNVEKKKNQFLSAVSEFSANYRKGSDYAKTAARLLDYIYYDGDDVGDEKISFTELFTAETIDETKLFNILLEGNSEILDIVYSAITLGLTETKGSTVLDRLTKETYKGKVGSGTQVVNDLIPSLKVELIKSETITEEANAYEGGVEAYLNNKAENGNSLEIAYYLYLYEMATKTQYGNTGLTLFEVMNLPMDKPDTEVDEEEEEEEGEEEEETKPKFTYIDDYLKDMLARSLTKGQLGATACVGLESILENAYAINAGQTSAEGIYKSNLQYINEQIDIIVLDKTITSISVFSGVDRSLFEHSDDVALTTAAIRADNKNNTCDLGKDASQKWFYSGEGRKVMWALAGVSGAISLGVGAAAMSMYLGAKDKLVTLYKLEMPMLPEGARIYYSDTTTAHEWATVYAKTLPVSGEECQEILDQMKLKSKTGYYDKSEKFQVYSSKLVTGLSVVAAVFLVATIALTICAIVSAKKQPAEKDIEYTTIPRAIVDMVQSEKEEDRYIPYYAVKQITATDTDTDYMKLYADLNGFNKKDEWLVLYASYDSRLGEPLTPEMVTGDNTDIIMDKDGVYSAIHDFGFSAAKNLNQFNKETGRKNVYVYLKRTVVTQNSGVPSTGSIFNLENSVIAVSFLAIGAFIAYAITFSAMKKKRKLQEG